jgi:hypothetical protein
MAEHAPSESAKVVGMAELPRGKTTYGPNSRHLKRMSRFQSWRSQRQRERRAQEIAQAVRRMPFPMYGLPPGWECRRSIMGSSYGKQTGLHGVRLGHRIGNGQKPVEVTVATSTGRGSVADIKEEVEFDLGLRDEHDETVGQLEWMRMRIPVDGAPTEFEVIAGRGAEWGAVGAVGDVVVGVEVRNFAMADVVLERVTDVEPYVAGARKS